MKPEDNKPVNGPDLDADLNNITDVYHRAQSEQPPDLLDQAVLNKARLAAGVKRSGWHFAGFRWVSAFATASVVVVSLALVMEQTTRVPRAPEIISRPAETAEAYEVDVLSAEDANVLMESSKESPAAVGNAVPVREERAQSPQQKIRRRDAAQAAGDSYSEDAPGAALPMPAEEQGHDDESALKDKRLNMIGLMASSKVAVDKADNDTGLQEAASDALDIEAEPILESELEEITVSGSAVLPDPPPPEVWIRRIMRWKNLQLNEKFERELAEFRKVYPNYELPEELKNR